MANLCAAISWFHLKEQPTPVGKNVIWKSFLYNRWFKKLKLWKVFFQAQNASEKNSHKQATDSAKFFMSNRRFSNHFSKGKGETQVTQVTGHSFTAWRSLAQDYFYKLFKKKKIAMFMFKVYKSSASTFAIWVINWTDQFYGIRSK